MVLVVRSLVFFALLLVAEASDSFDPSASCPLAHDNVEDLLDPVEDMRFLLESVKCYLDDGFFRTFRLEYLDFGGIEMENGEVLDEAGSRELPRICVPDNHFTDHSLVTLLDTHGLPAKLSGNPNSCASVMSPYHAQLSKIGKMMLSGIRSVMGDGEDVLATFNKAMEDVSVEVARQKIGDVLKEYAERLRSLGLNANNENDREKLDFLDLMYLLKPKAIIAPKNHPASSFGKTLNVASRPSVCGNYMEEGDVSIFAYIPRSSIFASDDTTPTRTLLKDTSAGFGTLQDAYIVHVPDTIDAKMVQMVKVSNRRSKAPYLCDSRNEMIERPRAVMSDEEALARRAKFEKAGRQKAHRHLHKN